ncbi:MAG TPA: sialidase family protein [Mycobacteriales bacterium]|nr:sialidase family protein [Mycobacteriales bacterium]
MLRPSRLIAAISVAAAAAATALLAPTASAAGPGAVKGGASKAYQATSFAAPAAASAPATPYYLTAPATGRTAATFSPRPPTTARTAVQATRPGGTGRFDDRTSASWSAPYAGKIAGPVILNWWWSSPNAASALGGANVTVRVFADPGTPQQKQIGAEVVQISAVGTKPQRNVSHVNVDGIVASALAVTAQATDLAPGEDLRVHYGSASAPSRFETPVAAAAAPKFPTTKAVTDRNPLVLSATPIGRKAAEPTIGITKAGNAFFTAADFDGLSPVTPQTRIYASYDGNRSWKDVSPEIAGTTFPPTTLDPYIYVDQETSRIYSDDLYVGCSILQWSDDQGKTWSRGNPLACESPVDDHQTLVTGNPAPGDITVGYPNAVYYCVSKVADAQCARSLDGGQVFLPSGAPAFLGVQEPQDGAGESGSVGFCNGLHGHIIVDPGGRLYLPKGHCGKPWLAVSEDGGKTWRQTRVNSLGSALTHTSVAADEAGNIYYLWMDSTNKLPYMAVSRDAGRTFGPALLVAPPGLRAANFPTIDAGAPGHVAISFPGTTDPDAGNKLRPWNYYVAVTDNALTKRPTFHSTTSNAIKDPVHRGACLGRCKGMFDFLDVVIAPTGTVWATLTDNCTKSCIQGGPASDAQGIAIKQLRGPGRPRR